MNDQLDIFGGATPLEQLAAQPREVRRDGRRTSQAAAALPDKPERYAELLSVMASKGTFTDDELSRMLPGLHPGTLSKRRLRLEKAGLVVGTGQQRPTRHGSPAIVFSITDQGRQVLAAWRT